MCTRFHCLPSVLLAEPGDLLRLLKLEELAAPEPDIDMDEGVAGGG